MKVLVIGGTGNVGSKVVNQLRDLNHKVIAAAPATGVNSYTGEGLAEAMEDVDVVIDLANSPEFDEQSSLDFFDKAGKNITAAAVNAGVKHLMAISIVGCDRMENLGYMKGKVRQEEIIRNSGIPYTIVRSTQFFEFVPFISTAATQGDEVHAPTTDFQPIAVKEAAEFIAKFALDNPKNGTVHIAGPERKPKSDFIEYYITGTDPEKTVIATGKNEYFGAEVPKDGMVPVGDHYLGKTRFSDWLESQTAVIS